MNKARRKTISNSLDELQATLPILKEALEHDKMVYDQISDDDDKESQASELEDRIDVQERVGQAPAPCGCSP